MPLSDCAFVQSPQPTRSAPQGQHDDSQGLKSMFQSILVKTYSQVDAQSIC